MSDRGTQNKCYLILNVALPDFDLQILKIEYLFKGWSLFAAQSILQERGEARGRFFTRHID